MAIELNKHGITPEYKPNEKLKQFIPLVLKEADEYTEFSLFDLGKILNLSTKDNLIFNELISKIRVYLIDEGFAKLYTANSHLIKLTEKGRNIKNGKEKIFGVVINNNFSNSTIGNLIQDSDLNNSVIKSKINNDTQPIKKPSKWAIIKSFCVKFWWAFIIPLAVIVIGLLIERGIIDIGL